jgi:hypothetical protein
MPMADYLAMRRGDGLAADASLRFHARAGGRIVRVAPTDGDGGFAGRMARLDRACRSTAPAM